MKYPYSSSFLQCTCQDAVLTLKHYRYSANLNSIFGNYLSLTRVSDIHI